MPVWAKPKPALTVARAVLAAEFTGMHVASGQPSGTRPDRYIVLSTLTADYPNPAFTEPRILVNCYAKTSLLAGDLADTAITTLLNARGLFAGAWVKKFADPQGPYPLNETLGTNRWRGDPDISDRYRFQFHGVLRLSTR